MKYEFKLLWAGFFYILMFAILKEYGIIDFHYYITSLLWGSVGYVAAKRCYEKLNYKENKVMFTISAIIGMHLGLLYAIIIGLIYLFIKNPDKKNKPKVKRKKIFKV